ncbi:hypothetical protein F2P56_024558 [Juglans regia]|uniref:Pentatricopeptide repeat-containing protein n=2 Tax=Juglans regia TaxID=51240 RepID=A0A833X0N1_JUGRE|nr:pentatricopeptide repeat-containing protein At5g56310-like [Juglans regia]KAF5454929.1 hypothetical protein F2P56_024558 [Juglans regia]
MVFDQMPNKNVVSWTSIVTAYAKHGLTLSAQKIFDNMPVKNLYLNMCDLRVVPDEATLVIILSACSQIGDLVMGKKIYNYICSNNSIHGVTLYNSLMDMYVKCGAPRIALDIFYKIPEKNTVSWNAIIGTLALHGHGLEAIDLFEKMQACGVQPDEIIFTRLLSACSHSGLIDLGRHYFHKEFYYTTTRCSLNLRTPADDKIISLKETDADPSDESFVNDAQIISQDKMISLKETAADPSDESFVNDAQIISQVVGSRSGYFRGLGRCVKPSSTPSSSSRGRSNDDKTNWRKQHLR